MSSANQDDIVAFLSGPASYGVAGTVERCETHGAIVFLAGERAYKLKRAVRFPYMDYSTPERRRAACESELAVNRRMAPSLYLEVRGIVRATDGKLGFGESDDPEAVDWVVVMKRFAQSSLLGEMWRQGRLNDTLMRKLADTIADVHSRAATTRDFGGAASIASVVEENIQILMSFEGTLFPRDHVLAYATASRSAAKAAAAQLDARRDAGFVRQCHGDLHLNNVCLIDDVPVLFDAIEFSDAFSHIDVFYDLAFLLMDLEHGGARALANAVLNTYLEHTADFPGLALLPLFLSCRAAVRAHVKAAQTTGAQDAEKEARAYLEEAIAFLAPARPQLIALGGVSGTGKSTLARAVAPTIGPAPGAVILRSDVLRKSLWGVAQNVPLPETAYAPEITKMVYDMLHSRAVEILAAGHAVIADAVYGTDEERSAIENAAHRASVPFHPIWLDAPRATLESRVTARKNDASDASIAVLHRQLAAIAPPADWLNVDAGGDAEETFRRVRTGLSRSC